MAVAEEASTILLLGGVAAGSYYCYSQGYMDEMIVRFPPFLDRFHVAQRGKVDQFEMEPDEVEPDRKKNPAGESTCLPTNLLYFLSSSSLSFSLSLSLPLQHGKPATEIASAADKAAHSVSSAAGDAAKRVDDVAHGLASAVAGAEKKIEGAAADLAKRAEAELKREAAAAKGWVDSAVSGVERAAGKLESEAEG